MLTHYRSFALSLVGFLAGALFISWVISGSVPFEACFQQEKHTDTYHALYENDDFVTKLIARIRLNGECGLRFFGDDSSVVTALATLLIDGFTFTLWRATDKMWIASRDQLKTASEALAHTISVDITTQRAYVTRTSITINTNVVDGGGAIRKFQIIPTWVNFGRTPARNVRFCSMVPIITNAVEDIPIDRTPEIVPVPIETFITMGANQPMSGGQAEIDPLILIPLGSREKRLFVTFRVEYDDIFTDTPRRIAQYCEEVEFTGLRPPELFSSQWRRGSWRMRLRSRAARQRAFRMLEPPAARIRL